MCRPSDVRGRLVPAPRGIGNGVQKRQSVDPVRRLCREAVLMDMSAMEEWTWA